MSTYNVFKDLYVLTKVLDNFYIQKL